MIVLAGFVLIASGYIAGRLHGVAARKTYIAQGFRIMQARADARGIPVYDDDAELWTAAEVSQAFGSLRGTS